MEKYKIEVKKSAERELRKIPKSELLKILEKIERLADDPRPPECIKLTGQERYRIRSGNYRILYSIEDSVLTVFVVKVGDRREVYRS